MTALKLASPPTTTAAMAMVTKVHPIQARSTFFPRTAFRFGHMPCSIRFAPWKPTKLRSYAYSSPTAMFTGIVEEMGRVSSVDPSSNEGGGFEMIINAQVALEGLKLGDSIAVNGTCLTVTHFDSKSFAVGLAPETLRRTSLGEALPGTCVNLERSLQPQSRMGGHFLQGHVDGTGTIISMTPEKDSLWVKVRAPPEILRYIVPKGFIAVDGTSLTVVDVSDEEGFFTFMLISYTQQKIVIPMKTVGSKVNLEVDILGKYVERLLQGYKASPAFQPQ